MLGLAGKLLDAARERGDVGRGRETQQLDLGYRSSPLSLDERAKDIAPRAGDRAPDAPCTGAGGQPLRLFTLLNSGGWTMLRYEARNASRPAHHRRWRRRRTARRRRPPLVAAFITGAA
jgi:hypothetical protein